MKPVLSLRTTKQRKRSMSEFELMKAISELSREIRDLRVELLRIKNQASEKGIKTKFLKMKEACMYLRISRETMRKRIATGEITFAAKKGNTYLFPEEKLRAYASGIS